MASQKGNELVGSQGHMSIPFEEVPKRALGSFLKLPNASGELDMIRSLNQKGILPLFIVEEVVPFRIHRYCSLRLPDPIHGGFNDLLYFWDEGRTQAHVVNEDWARWQSRVVWPVYQERFKREKEQKKQVKRAQKSLKRRGGRGDHTPLSGLK